MSPVAAGMAIAFIAAGAAAVAAMTMPARARRILVGLLTTLSGAGGVLAGLAALGGQQFSLTLQQVLPFDGIELHLDPLSGLFLVLIGAVAAAVGVYSVGYTSPGGHHGHQDLPPGGGAGSRTAQTMLPVFVAAMLLVPAAANVTTFLAAWELMALASLTLVLTEYRSRQQVGDAGLWYAAMTQAGVVAIMVGFALLAAGVGGESFEAIREGAPDLSPLVRSTAFVLVFIGFGSKAGLVPLHVWLPRAHAEAPSHVSALMSAAMVNLGFYGIIRVGFDLLGGGPRWWGWLLLAVGTVSALYGVLQASVATDLKRLLGYSTTENLGIMLMGLGAGAVFAGEGNRVLASLLVAAALLHALNHGAFKALLFLGAGSVMRSTGTRDLDQLGGLASRMPVTTALVAVGALGAATLPPGNGFVSEWLLLQGFTHSLGMDGVTDTVTTVAMPLAVAALALTTGLAVVAFVKAFGIGFLARPRTAEAAAAVESPWSMRLAMGAAALVCTGLAWFPALLGESLVRAISVLPSVRDGNPIGRDGVTIRLAGISGSMSPFLVAVALAAGMAAAAAGARWAQTRVPVRRAVPWGSGRRSLTPRMEYTATSFAEPLTRVFDDVLSPEHDLNVTPHVESQYLIESVSFRQKVPDRIEARLYPPVISAVRRWGEWARRAQNGDLHRYVAVGFVVLIGVLVLVGVTA
ncbi:proton-conducting transporter membrane subunit [Rhodococcus opacus]|uniref:proton-conducting transporter transmembrane domain-containing protein n=2 Tax=Rhodococcus opacus TaxID=37919 RepID=UPI0007CD8564|nr:proton-conducting transporter membrane subunit [Rhodococcus opacus]MDX5962468.1 proton-conducting transporter membrane subunit [Rhodococcus opacus]CAG7640059.1 Hydrogenase-4 component B [Rhodococcus opacus]